MRVAKYYEQYWLNPRSFATDHGYLVKERETQLVLVLAKVPPGSKILDVGCGSGVFANFFHTRGHQVVGTDISENVVGYAREQYPAILFEAASVEDRIPFGANEFEVVWSSEVLEHLFDVHSTLCEMSRVGRMSSVV